MKFEKQEFDLCIKTPKGNLTFTEEEWEALRLAPEIIGTTHNGVTTLLPWEDLAKLNRVRVEIHKEN